jgi:hypothetical protein
MLYTEKKAVTAELYEGVIDCKENSITETRVI